MTQINGLLTQKQESAAPQAGDARIFSWEERTGKSGKPWIKIKNEGSLDYGQQCEVVKVEKTDFVDQHKNVSFNVSFIPSDDAGAVGGGAEKGASNAAPATSDERGDKIDRAVAFKAAARIIGYQVQGGKIEAEMVVQSVKLLTDQLLSILTHPRGAADPKSEERLDEGVPF